MQITFVGECGVQCSNGTGSQVLEAQLNQAECVAALRTLHAQQAWGTELNHPSYAALHYAGLAAIEQVANGVPGYYLVPVQFGTLVVT